MAPGHCDIEKALNLEEMEGFKQKLKSWSKNFLSGKEKNDEILAYSVFFRALSSDIEGRCEIFAKDFVKICRRIVYGPDGAFDDYDQTRGFVFDSVPDMADKFLPEWFAKEVRRIIMSQPQKPQN